MKKKKRPCQINKILKKIIERKKIKRKWFFFFAINPQFLLFSFVFLNFLRYQTWYPTTQQSEKVLLYLEQIPNTENVKKLQKTWTINNSIKLSKLRKDWVWPVLF